MLYLGTLSVLGYFFLALSVVAFGVEAWALIDALIRPTQAFVAVGKQTKPLWLVILGVATAVGLGYAFYAGGASIVQFLPVAAFVAAAIYLTDVRPKVKDFRGGGNSGTSYGPYGPW